MPDYEWPHPETVQGTAIGTPDGFIGASVGWCAPSGMVWGDDTDVELIPGRVSLPVAAERGSITYGIPAWGQKQEI